MKVLTVRHPWAWAIAHGGKDIENRATLWKYRGPLLIHAGAGWSDRGEHDQRVVGAWWEVADDHGLEPLEGVLELDELHPGAVSGRGHHLPVELAMPRSHVVAAADLVDVHRIGAGCDDDCAGSCWAESEYQHADGRTIHDVVHLVLHDVVALPEPIHYPFGGLGLRDPRPELVAEVQAQLDLVA